MHFSKLTILQFCTLCPWNFDLCVKQQNKARLPIHSVENWNFTCQSIFTWNQYPSWFHKNNCTCCAIDFTLIFSTMWKCGRILLPVVFYVKSTLHKSKVSEIAILTISEALNFDFYKTRKLPNFHSVSIKCNFTKKCKLIIAIIFFSLFRPLKHMMF